MIKDFRCKHTEKVFFREAASKFSHDVYRKALRKLLLLDAAERLDDLRVPPGNQLEKLGGDRKGRYSIRINDQWRLCFRWDEGNAFEVEIVDYH
ncbi:MAG: type II toxin-antitoxin system RelE/ParE family toxin [Syntrophorhabdales bacterium]